MTTLPMKTLTMGITKPVTSIGTLETSKGSSFFVASCFPPIPAKLVKKMQSLKFVEMRELLADNIELAERLEALPVAARGSNIPQRDIESVNTWTCAFATYTAAVAQAYPARVCDMLAYMRLIVHKAQKYKEGISWLLYDSVFRQNNQGPDARWTNWTCHCTRHILGDKGHLVAKLCRHCGEVNHSPNSCALSHLTPKVRPTNPPQFESPAQAQQPTVKQRSGFICQSWNAGKCRLPRTCYYRHVC